MLLGFLQNRFCSLSKMNVLLLLALFPAICVNSAPYGDNNALPELRVVNVISPPFTTDAGNGQPGGPVIALLDLIAELVGFTYTIHAPADNQYGSQDPVTGKWNGMVGELIDGKADLAAVDFTLTSKRDLVIDFTSPIDSSKLRALVNINDDITKVKYATRTGTASNTLLESSQDPIVAAISANVQANNILVATIEEGVALVLAGGVALIDNEASLENAIKTNPEKLKLTDNILAVTYDAFGVPQNSAWRDKIGIAIETLNEQGKLKVR